MNIILLKIVIKIRISWHHSFPCSHLEFCRMSYFMSHYFCQFWRRCLKLRSSYCKWKFWV